MTIPFTFDEMPDGHLWDQDLIKEANVNRSFEVEDVYRGFQLLNHGRMSSML